MKRSTTVVLLSFLALTAFGFTAASVTADFPLPPAPNGACVFKNGSCQVTQQNLCKLSKGTWLGPDTACP